MLLLAALQDKHQCKKVMLREMQKCIIHCTRNNAVCLSGPSFGIQIFLSHNEWKKCRSVTVKYSRFLCVMLIRSSILKTWKHQKKGKEIINCLLVVKHKICWNNYRIITCHIRYKMSDKQLIGDADNCIDNLFEFNQSFLRITISRKVKAIEIDVVFKLKSTFWLFVW